MTAADRFGIAILICLLAAPAAAKDSIAYTLPSCADAPADNPGCVEETLPPQAEIESGLGSRDAYAWAKNDELIVAARRDFGPVQMCCAVTAPLTHVGQGDLWAARLRIRGLDRAILSVEVFPQTPSGGILVYRGAHSPPVPQPTDHLAGAVVDETVQSERLHEPRKLSIYTPPGFDPAKTYPVVYLADGFRVAADARLIDPLIVAGRLPAVVLVGLWPGSSPRENLRAHEYLIGDEPHSFRYRAHEAFLLDEVLPLAERKYGAATAAKLRLISGFSDGGSWALSIGLAHPDVFAHVAAFSVSWPAAAEGAEQPGRPALFLAAGSLEPYFLGITARAAQRAQLAQGAEIVFRQGVSGHSLLAWQPWLIQVIDWSFGGPP